MKKNASYDDKPQITMSDPEVISWPQDVSGGALEPPSPKKPKAQGGAPLTRREEENEFPIQTGPEHMEKTPATMANPKLLRPLQKSILDPKRWKLAH